MLAFCRKICYDVGENAGKEAKACTATVTFIWRWTAPTGRQALARHKTAPDEAFIRATLKNYQALGFDFLRDGGDRWGAGEFAAKIAAEYGIGTGRRASRSTSAAITAASSAADMRRSTSSVRWCARSRSAGGHFIKIMISGLMDFNHYGILTDTPMPTDEVAAITDIAHEAGFAVMAHANGDAAVSAAIAAGIDSVEHGAYLTEETLHQLAEEPDGLGSNTGDNR